MVRGSGAVAAFVTVALGLAACGGAGQQAASDPDFVPSPTTVAGPPPAAPSQPPLPQTGTMLPEKPVFVPVAAVPAAAVPPRPATPAPAPGLVGLDRAGVLKALGKPKMVRRDATAEVMTFIVPECALFVFIYDRPNAAGTVRHIEARSRKGSELVSETACIGNVISRNGPGSVNPA